MCSVSSALSLSPLCVYLGGALFVFGAATGREYFCLSGWVPAPAVCHRSIADRSGVVPPCGGSAVSTYICPDGAHGAACGPLPSYVWLSLSISPSCAGVDSIST